MIHGNYSQTGELQIASAARETVRWNHLAGSYALIESRWTKQTVVHIVSPPLTYRHHSTEVKNTLSYAN